MAAILSGQKTSTTSTLREYSVEDEELPVVGERAAVVDNRGLFRPMTDDAELVLQRCRVIEVL